MAGKTEWEDALIKHGIMEAPEVLPTGDETYTEQLEALAEEDALAGKSLAQLDELEDDLDEKTVQTYRERRLAQLREEAKRNKFGTVQFITQTDFVREVSEASEDGPVVVHLFVSGLPQCQLLDQCMARVAAKYKAIKFVRIVSVDCIPNYPDKNCPTLLVYDKGAIRTQIIGLDTMGGMKMNADCLEWALTACGVLITDLEENPVAKLRTTVTRLAPSMRGEHVTSGVDVDRDTDRERESARATTKPAIRASNFRDEDLAELEAEFDELLAD